MLLDAQFVCGKIGEYVLTPALIELPIIRVVQPAYHCAPNGGHGSFFPSGNLRLSWDRVLATVDRQ
jgi:hypothetical protein